MSIPEKERIQNPHRIINFLSQFSKEITRDVFSSFFFLITNFSPSSHKLSHYQTTNFPSSGRNRGACRKIALFLIRRRRSVLCEGKAGNAKVSAVLEVDLYFEEVRVTVRVAGSYRNQRGHGENARVRNNGETRACNTASCYRIERSWNRYLANYLIAIRTKAASRDAALESLQRKRITRWPLIEQIFSRLIEAIIFFTSWYIRSLPGTLCNLL